MFAKRLLVACCVCSVAAAAEPQRSQPHSPPSAGAGASPAALLDPLELRWDDAPAARHAQVPAAILQLAPRYRHVVVADLADNRVYLFANDNGVPRRVAEFYASIGQAGPGKEAAGDRRTPVGIYRVTRYIDGAALPERYGAGALAIDYPNALDRSLGRTGDGIWLHGTPRGRRERTPRASEGCVVLANGGFNTLRERVVPGVTPVILAADMEWIDAGAAERRRKSMLDRLARWRRSWEAIDTERFLGFYSPTFANDEGEDKAAFAAQKERVNAAKTRISVNLGEISVFRYPGEAMIKATFDQHYHSNNYAGRTRKSQYWQRDGEGRWRIVLETQQRPPARASR